MTYTSTLLDYASQRDLADEPSVRMVSSNGRWREDRDFIGAQPTIAVASRMAAARIDRVEVCWEHTTADFAVSELVPKTGLRAHAEVGEWPTN
jgi:hypothetical protein